VRRRRAKEEDMLFAQPFEAETAASPESAVPDWIRSIGHRLSAWASACADYYSAAALYDELRTLSDAELQRRGLSRDTLARDVCKACDTLGGR
jgi:hypothetical protein